MKAHDFTEKALQLASKVQGNKYLSSISQGLMGMLPVMIIGSMSLLLAVLPVQFVKDALGALGITGYLFTAFSLTIGLISIYASYLIGAKLAENFGYDGKVPGLMSIFGFLLLTPMAETGGLNMPWLGAQGLFTAMITAIFVSRVYVFFMDRKLVIKMPDSVPANVASVFTGLIPAVLAAIAVIVVALIFGKTSYGSFSNFVYTIIAMPLQNLSGNVWSLVFIVFVQMILWFFGLHGSMVVGAFIDALYLPMDVANMGAVAAGVANSELPNILGKGFYSLFAGIGGAGGTLALLMIILVVSKSQKHRAIGKLSIVPGMFTINEPVVFGLPLILNPIMAVPFIVTPLVQVLVAYAGIASGLFPRLNGVSAPFGTPIFVNGFILGGWRIALLQLICVAVGILIYLPFFKVLDKKAEQEELSGEFVSE